MLEKPVSSPRKRSKASFSTCSWLDTLPFDASDFSDPSTAPTPPARKRRDLHKRTDSREKKREVLGAISFNRMPASPPKPFPQNPIAKSVMPKTPSEKISSPVRAGHSERGEESVDPDLTPTANAPHCINPRSCRPQQSPTRRSTRISEQITKHLPQHSKSVTSDEEFWAGSKGGEEIIHQSASEAGRGVAMLTLEDDDDEDNDNDNDNDSESQETSSGRSTSNVRLKGIRVVETSIEDKTYPPLNEGMKSLVRDLHQIGRGSKVIPSRYRQVAQEASFLLDGSDYFSTTDPECHIKALPATEEESADFWKEIVKIEDSTQECMRKKFSEAGWNCEVHSRLLRLALQGYWKEQNVWYRNVTAHRIIEKAIIPQLRGKAKPGSIVDFSIVTELSQTTLEEIYAKLRVRKTSNINQTGAEDVEESVLAINMETKVKIIDGGKGVRQLIVWSLAQFNKFQQLSPNLAWNELPALPAILTFNHAWNLLIIRKIADDEVLVQSGFQVGRSDNILGIFQILAAIQRLAKWAKDDYMVWWDRNILK